MQTNMPYGLSDISLITRLYQKQNKIKKTYRITYLSRNGKEDFVGATDKEEAEQKRKEIESLGHKVSSIKVLKAKVYIKTPQDAPKNVKIQEGPKGGQYYESEQQSQQEETKPGEIKPQHYEGLKQGSYYKGFDGKYDVFHFDNAVIKANPQDLPSDITNKILQCSDSFKFSSLKKKPNIILLGKSVRQPFTWTDRIGQDHQTEFGGTANYNTNEIELWDDFSINSIVYHEVGHFVCKNMFYQEGVKISSTLEGFESIEDINKYNKMIEILKNHNIQINKENIYRILEEIEYTRSLNILEDMHRNGLEYYDEGYNSLFALEQRLNRNNNPELLPNEVNEWKKYRIQRKKEIKSNILRSEWQQIWQSEGFLGNEYADRNYNECFAEFYQAVDKVLREEDLPFRRHLFRILQSQHPKKLEFFKKYVIKKWLK